uniref:Hybrid PKS-NRPS synthetase iccA n=1 Tax=Talaromyces variabilis TaxID=28576 RepID=ICCA_TALVA|nr:RecName: Full=Hybrid PKS-NRPS synthetase iccA; Short=PKS-NRPS iccA; AltName: Full=Ilicicolin H biosynthesis cluster protein A [Talaromyces variabilis]QBQ83704.1 polyketide synthase-nonribosomal peptide synthetase [Talaromyces variabilis]
MAANDSNNQTKPQLPEEPVAIVGSSCRFPGSSNSPSKLWDLLRQPRDVLKEFDPDRLNLKRFYHPDGDTHGSTDVTNKSYLLEEDSRLFDASFFTINPAEAAGMDPQQRILLETVYEAFESAGMTLEQLRGSLTAVHVGTMTNDYAGIQLRDLETIAKYNATGTANSIVSNRISYVFDLKGPSETIDTACSSSLVALHHAARGLLNGDCETAVVAGVNLIYDAASYIAESKLHMLSPDSQSRMWDKSANGYARGEGAAALLLKPLSRALRDGDHIEGVIRATGVNSDGQSPGITMPFAPTQAALIRQTYRRAGLDPVKDRPQYFECHGTGTPAGDPVEARAISEAFEPSADNPIYVGSIKTIIGHLEGCAGLAGVMKVILALKNRTIPPNMLFNELNPAIAPFYGPLQIPKKAMPWPELPENTPIRASVNSFGFGGTNAHVIIESFESSTPSSDSEKCEEGALGPLLFSAGSGASLLHTVQAYVQYLDQNPSVDLRDLSWLLQTRRSTHRVRTHFSGTSSDAILESMIKFVNNNEKTPSTEVGHQPKLINPKEVPGILGVFTGQGAQWPQMGKELIGKSPIFRRTLEDCDATLQALPSSDIPKWSLVKELMANASSSRVAEAAISQPLCTAVQLGLVNMLKASGLNFDAVVGHSSGEIAATYASGIINLQAAIQIAYYRGFHAKLAKGEKGQQGGMLAAGLTLDKAKQLCLREEFVGRLQVAASNAPQTVTLSGDLDAIEEVKKYLDEENVFARQLKVDTAYHSHHMKPCAEPYLKSLLACDIEVRKPTPGQCIWNSSVRGDTGLLKGDLSSLKGPYWVANMVQTVLFSQAVESSIWHGGPWDLAIEVGPHPALKGPTEQTLKAVYGVVPLYTGVLKRGASDVEAFSTAIGVTWSQLGPSFVDFAGYRKTFYESEPPTPKVIKDLPGYSWDHDKVYWRESRISKRYRTGRDQTHELLGRRTPDDNEFELRWRNVLKLSEMPWLRGHEVLEEVLLPGAAYVSIAVEASKHIATSKGKSIELLEVEDVDIQRPVVVPDNKEGVETLFTARLLPGSSSDKVLKALFSYYICNDQSTGTMVHTCSGRLSVHLGEAKEDVLPQRDPVPQNLVNINTDRAYGMFKDIGLNYTGVFRSIKESSRTLQYSAATGIWPEGSLSDKYLVHPAMLDVAFQTLFIARAHPASRLITSALLPSHIERIQVSPSVPILHARENSDEIKADFDCWVVHQTASSLTGDLNIYDKVSGKTFLQVEGLTTKMVGEQDASGDRPVFTKTVWGSDGSLGLDEPERDPVGDAEGLSLAEAAERMALFYMKRVVKEISPEERTKFQWYHQRMFEAFEQHLVNVGSGSHPMLKSEWLSDDSSIMDGLDRIHPTSIDLKLLRACGENMPDVVREKTQLLEVMSKDDMLNRFYMDNCAARINNDIAKVVKQISFKFPRANILEIGAGTGGTTWSILKDINDAYDSYTFTDISSGFFPKAAEKFSDFAHKMIFKTLDVEKQPSEQGFAENSYDVIVAANVLHATRSLETTLRNARSLLRPGGYLILMEITNPESLRTTFIFGGFSGWWLSEEPHRKLGPVVTAMDWDTVLNDTGYSGADMVVHDLAEESKHLTSLIVSQAVDDDFLRLREPLSNLADMSAPTESILVIGGKKLLTSKMVNEINKLLPKSWKRHISSAGSIDDIDINELKPGTEVISLQELDDPLFSTPMTAERMSTIQNLMMSAKTLLWVTTAGKSHAPRASMFHGIARIVPSELQHLQIQVLGLEAGSTPAIATRHCVEAFLRLRGTSDTTREMLWAIEPEVEIMADGQVLIPRVVPDETLNQTYNASRRVVTKTVDATDLAVEAVAGPTKMMLQTAELQAGERKTRIQVKYALHLPAMDGKGIYVVYGQRQDDTSSFVLAVSKSNSSIVDVDSKHAVSVSDNCEPATLNVLATYLIARAIATLSKQAGSVLLSEPEESLAAIVATETAKQGTQAYFLSSKKVSPVEWIKVHANASKRAIQKAVPHDVQLLIDCSGIEASGNAVMASMPLHCVERQLDAHLLFDALESTESKPESLLEEAYQYATQLITQEQVQSECEVFPASDLPLTNMLSLVHKKYVTDWQQRDSLVVSVPPLDLEGIFKADKTYLMVGAAGGLGLSICEWMIRNGAKNLIITSRKPQVDQNMIEEASRVGATVKVMAMDVSSKESVAEVVQQAQEIMPPIAGVCNAAMVLSDKMFLDMDVDQLNGTLAAKVYGTEHLDAVFADAPLDFFIVLSSTATTIGNIGQANYHVANLFMTSLVAQRRARGLAGSVIHIGYVADVGYVTRQDRERQLEQHFRNVRLMALSETDVHHAFAEAVRGGRPGNTVGSPDIIMGLEPASVPLEPERQTLWLSNPCFGHLVPSTLQNDSSQTGGTGNGSSVRRQVEEAQTEDEAVDAVLDGFCAKLEAILQLREGSVKENVQRAVIDLGIDSLVAVEIRTWFLKELGAEVPVVKILGGDTVLQICTTAAKKVMANAMKKKEEDAVAEEGGREAASKKEPAPAASAPTPAPVAPSLLDVPARAFEPDSATISEVGDDSAFSNKGSSSSATGASSPKELSDSESVPDTSKDQSHVRPETVRDERMSPAQARIWFLTKHLDDPSAYNMVFHYRVKGPLKTVRLRHALQVATGHHESLRTLFYSRLEDGQPMQGVMPASAYELKHVPGADEADLKKELALLKAREWDLENGRTFSVSVLSRAADEHDVVFGYHHIIMDVVGWYFFVRDLDRAYRMQPFDKKISGSYVDYSVMQLSQKNTAAASDDLAFWQKEFSTVPDPIPLLPIAAVSARPTDSGRKVSHHEYLELDPAQNLAVKETCEKLRISPFHFHVAVLRALIGGYTNIDDMCIGVVDANRGDERFAQTVGCFVNMLPVRVEAPSDATFADIARSASRKALMAFAHSSAPLDMILDAVKAPRSSETTPLFQVAVNYRTGGVWDLPMGDCQMKLSLTDGKDAENPFDISLGIAETGKGCVIEMHCQKTLYSSDATRTLLNTYLRLVDTFCKNTHVKLKDCVIHDQAKVSEALQIGKGPTTDFGWPSTLSHRVLETCLKSPKNAAIQFKGELLSYEQLASRIHLVAAAIVRAGASKGSRVAVLCEPSADAIISMLATLHIGGVYIPMDVSLPTARHAAMMNGGQPTLLLSHAATKHRVEDLVNETGSTISVLQVDTISSVEEKETVSCAAEPHNNAVLLFTSGSTGTPKGIMLSQANFVNHLALKTDRLQLGQENVLQQSSMGFDMSLIQMFCALANGGCLVIAPSEMRRDPVELTNLVHNSQISLTIATPSEYLAWLRYGTASLKDHTIWRHACMGGEPVSRQLKTEFWRLDLANLQLTNCYGPTEITAAATFETIRLDDQDDDNDRAQHAVGKALPNYSVRILDTAGRPQPVDHIGEICIGGASVALGYLGLPEQTKAKFTVDPVSGERLYLTGDKGKLLSDGTLLCLGRLDGDTQIKHRGLRIELQEVESALIQTANGLFSSAVVSARGSILVAHATISQSQAEPSESDLAKILSRLKLPQYFIPATIGILPTMPTTANGKLDRKAIASLPLPQKVTGEEGPQEKMNIREGELRLLWERVLPDTATTTPLGPSSDFFLCGGNSMLLMKLQAAIKESIGIEISTRVLYQASTLREMALCVDEQREEQADALEQHFDWQAETSLPKWLLDQIEDLPKTTKQPPKPNGIDILMTGATSFIGGRLLRSLVRSPSVRKVHCVAVLADEQDQLYQDEKVKCYTGSLLSSTLGLNNGERDQLARNVDVVIHAGSSGHCLNTYGSLRTPNLVSLQFLASLALPRSIPLLLLSSNRVPLLSGNTALPPTSVAAFPPATDGREGYTATKWASEVFLEKLVGAVQKKAPRPWVASVHRPCVVVSEHAPNSDALNAILRYSASMKCVPHLESATGYLDFASVESIVDSMAESAIEMATGNVTDQPSIRFQHHSGGVKVPIGDFKVHMENVYGGNFEEVHLEEWMHRAAAAGLDPLITAYMEGIIEAGAPIVFPYLGETV